MRTEISALFCLQSRFETLVESTCIGTGVYLQRLESSWLDEVRVQCPKVQAREQIEPLGSYTHRFFCELELEEADPNYFDLPTDKEKQLLLRAIVLSRIIKPTSIAYDSVWVKSIYHTSRPASHASDPVMRGSNLAFVIPHEEDWNTITQRDAIMMAALWPSFQFLFDNERDYRRIVRAIQYHEWAYSMWLPMLSHMIIHAALESMICVPKMPNKPQVTQRLPKVVSFPITPQEAEDIYLTCCDFKHAAAAMFQQGPTSSGALSHSDQRRADAVKLLRRAVRDILTRALEDRKFANMLANPSLLNQQHPVYDRNGKPIKERK